MLQDVAAENDVEGILRERNRGDIGVNDGTRAAEVRTDVVEVLLRFQPLLQNSLGGEMQHAQPVREEIRLVGEVQPEQSMSVSGAAIRAARAGSVGSNRSNDRHEAAKRAVAQWTLDAITAIPKRERGMQRRTVQS